MRVIGEGAKTGQNEQFHCPFKNPSLGTCSKSGSTLRADRQIAPEGLGPGTPSPSSREVRAEARIWVAAFPGSRLLKRGEICPTGSVPVHKAARASLRWTALQKCKRRFSVQQNVNTALIPGDQA